MSAPLIVARVNNLDLAHDTMCAFFPCNCGVDTEYTGIEVSRFIEMLCLCREDVPPELLLILLLPATQVDEVISVRSNLQGH